MVFRARAEKRHRCVAGCHLGCRGRWHAAIGIGAATVCCAGAAGGFALKVARLGPPDLADARQVSTTVLDRNDRLLRAFTTEEGRWRLPLEPSEVDQRYLAMLMAFEDKRFYLHHGIDTRSLARAAWQLVENRHIVSGASTLTMQVARLVEGHYERSGSAKVRQIVGALQLERYLSKREILALYLKLAPFGGNIEGVRAASLTISARSRGGSPSARPRCWWRCRSRPRCAVPTATRAPRAWPATACSRVPSPPA